jgi:hypothetical protein
VRLTGGIVVRRTSANTLVMGSEIENSDVGIHANRTTTEMFGAQERAAALSSSSTTPSPRACCRTTIRYRPPRAHRRVSEASKRSPFSKSDT